MSIIKTMQLTHRHTYQYQHTHNENQAGVVCSKNSVATAAVKANSSKPKSNNHMKSSKSNNNLCPDYDLTSSPYKLSFFSRRLMILFLLLFTAFRRIYNKNFKLDPDFISSNPHHDASAHSLRPGRIQQEYKDKILHRNVNSKGPGRQGDHDHMIPNIAIFTYKFDLLTVNDSLLSEEELMLKKNVEHSISYHRGVKVRFLDDKQCLDSIRTVMQMHPQKLTNLDTYFIREPRGMFKSDICRGAALYESGGLYFDIDIKLRMSMWDVVDADTEFVVPQVYEASRDHGMFFQAFIGAKKQHPMLLRYLEKFCSFYSGNLRLKKHHFSFYKPFLGVALLRYAYDDMPREIKENTVFWKEVKYSRYLFPDVKPPSGIRRSCHYVTAIPGTHIVPFYSRTPESRLCQFDGSLKELSTSIFEYAKFTLIP